METLGIIGLFVGIIVLITVSYCGFHAVPTSLLAAVIIMILNGINIWSGLTSYWIGGLAGVFTSYFLLFLASTLFANLMQITGACESISYKLIDWFGTKHIVTVLAAICFLLCYGGISFFVIMFAIGPIAFSIFEELNIPRKHIILVTATGCGAFVLATPGSPQIQNVIPTALGTTMMAAPILGWLMTIAGSVICVVIAEYIYKKDMEKVAAGEIEGWTPIGGASSVAKVRNREDVPSAVGGFLPIVVVIAVIIIASIIFPEASSTMLAVIAMCLGIITTLVINYSYIKSDNKTALFKDWLAQGSVSAGTSALVLGAVVGFGSVVSGTEAFQSVVAWVMALDMNTYWKAVISTSVIAGICGSASSGGTLTMQYLGEYFINSGANLEVLHRLISMASITFDALPHATGCFLMLAYFGVTHRTAYKYIFVQNVIVPVVIVVVFTFICTIIY